MDEKADLIREAKALGINVSMYWLLPSRKREVALRADIARAREERKNGTEKI